MAAYNNSTVPPEWSGSGSGDDEDLSLDEDVAPWEICVVLLMVIPTVAVNAFVVYLIMRKSSLKTASNLILASLAFSDLLLGALGIPLILACSVILRDSVCSSSAIVITFISFSTVAHIMLHTCDRYIYIMRALRYEELMYPRRAYRILTLTWIITLVASAARLFYSIDFDADTVDDQEEELMEEAIRQKEHIYSIFSLTCFFCLPLVIITFMDAHMMCVIHRQSKLISQQNLPSELRKQSAKLLIGRKRKAVLTCILILIVYVLCWLPYFVLVWLEQMVKEGTLQIPLGLFWFVYYVRFMSSVCNPWLYTLRKHDLREAASSWVKNIFPCLRRRQRNQDIEMEMLTLHTENTTVN